MRLYARDPEPWSTAATPRPPSRVSRSDDPVLATHWPRGESPSGVHAALFQVQFPLEITQDLVADLVLGAKAEQRLALGVDDRAPDLPRFERRFRTGVKYAAMYRSGKGRSGRSASDRPGSAAPPAPTQGQSADDQEDRVGDVEPARERDERRDGDQQPQEEIG